MVTVAGSHFSKQPDSLASNSTKTLQSLLVGHLDLAQEWLSYDRLNCSTVHAILTSILK